MPSADQDASRGIEMSDEIVISQENVLSCLRDKESTAEDIVWELCPWGPEDIQKVKINVYHALKRLRRHGLVEHCGYRRSENGQRMKIWTAKTTTTDSGRSQDSARDAER